MTASARRAAAMLPVLGIAALWVGIALAARRFPTELDWRYMTMSTLLSPRDNPAGRAWAAVGIGLCGLCLLAWTAVAGRSARPVTPTRDAARGLWAIRCGSACMVGAGVLPLRLPGLAKGHEMLTLLAFAGLCIGTIQRITHSVERDTSGHSSDATRGARLGGAALAGILIGPIIAAGLAQAYVFYVLPELHWVGLSWRTRGVPVYLSFAFWEWLTCAVLSTDLIVLALRER
jgi:hypothetical protein